MTDVKWFRTFLDPPRPSAATKPSPRAGPGDLVEASERTVARSARGIRQLELNLSAISAVGRQQCLGRDPPRLAGNGVSDTALDATINRAIIARPLEKGVKRNALGRSRGASRPKSTFAPTPMACRSTS
jgi:hypothetical protein